MCEYIYSQHYSTIRLLRAFDKGYINVGFSPTPSARLYSVDNGELVGLIHAVRISVRVPLSAANPTRTNPQSNKRLATNRSGDSTVNIYFNTILTYLCVVTYGRVVWAINSFAPYKSPGMDGRSLFLTWSRFFAPAYVPATWRQAKVVFILKPGRDSYGGPKDYRLTSLTSFLLKTMERLIDFLRG
jgi:hypothetical protein